MISDSQILDQEVLKRLATESSFLRGINYYEEGRVSNPIADNKTLRAQVAGSEIIDYEVELSIKPPYNSYCTCPYDWGGICKHRVAAALAWLNNPDSFTKIEDKKKEIKNEMEKVFAQLERKDLEELLVDLISRDEYIKMQILNLLKEIKGETSLLVQIERLKVLMNNSLDIVREFSAYGGGPEDDEIQCCNHMYEMEEILNSDDIQISQEIRREIISEFMEWYLDSNSGFNDQLLEVIFAAAENKEDWKFIIQGLKQSDSSYDQEKIMNIYLHQLGEEDKYLKLRKKKLIYGMDYYRLASYYHGKGQEDKAAQTALQGIKQGKGRIIDNLTYLKEYYLRHDNTEKALKYAVEEYKEDPDLNRYKFILDICDSEKKELLRVELKSFLRENMNFRYIHTLAAIYWEEKEYDQLLELVIKKGLKPGKYENFLCKKYPQKMIPYFKNQVRKFINMKKRKSYAQGAEVALKIRKIYIEYLKSPDIWKEYLQSILDNYPRHRALQEEFRSKCF